MSNQEFNSYIGTVHSSIYGTTGEYLATSVSLNFESDRVALGTSNVQNYTGNVYIYDYNGTSWTKNFSLSGPDGQNSSFGHDVSFNWSGTRLAISAYQVNKVYILDATGTGANIWSSYVSNTLNTSSLSLPGTAEFGYSISLAQDNGNRIAVGSPGQNKVYVYEYDSANNNWGSGPVWSSTDSGINNVLAYAVDSSGLATSYVHAHAISNRYGHKVRLTGFGNYLIIGAPGETNATINSTTAYYPEGTTTNYTGSYTGQHQIGHVRCYTNEGDTWASGTTQYGQDVRGKAGIELGNSSGQQPGFGTSCDISTNGNKIVVSSPYKYVETYDAGQIDTYLINEDLDTWLSVSTSITGTKIQKNLGMNVRLDYAGERLATGDLQQDGQIQQSQWYSGISLFAFDFGTDRWYDITKPIQLLEWPTYSDEERNPLDITNGKIIAISNPRYPAYNNPPPGTQGSVIFYQFPITQNIQGNMLVGGYLKCENFYVGANDSSTNTDHTTESKRISFGGTVVDNAYDQTYIENRSVDGTGKSELLLYKRNDMYDREGGNPASSYGAIDDTIRLKAAEICLDYEDANYHGAGDNAGQRTTRFLLNRSGQIALGNAYYNGEFDVVTDIDVNDKSFFWTTVNIGNKTNKPPNLTPALNTNNERLFLGLSTSSTPIGTDGKYGNQQFERYNVSSQAWDGDEFAFYFSNSDATIYEDTHPGNWHGSNGQFSCWIKLNDTQANCAGVLAWFGHDLHRTGTSYRGGWVKLTSSGLQFEYEANSANVQTVSYTFNQGSWYHVAVCFPTENTYPSASSSKWPKVKIDNVIQTISANPGSAYSSGVEFDNSAYGFGSFLTFSRDSNGNVIFSGEIPVVSGSENNGVKNCWIALMDIGNGDIDSNELYKVLPGEMLTVGGICTITKYLGIGVSSPKYQLDVDGNINFTGNIYQNNNLFSSDTFITGLDSTAGVYPLSAMSANSSGVHVASASSTNPSDWQAWKAFNQTVGDEGWHTVDAYNSSTGYYAGTQSTTYNGSSTVSGEWVQLQFTVGYGIAINKIEIAPRTGYVNRCAGDGIILGSANGSTWTSIATFSGKTYTNGSYTSITFTTSSIYTYFRLVVTKLSGTGHQTLNISEIRYTGVDIASNYIYYPEVGTNKNVGINTSSPEAYLHVKRETSSGESNVYIQSYSDDTGDQAALFLGTPHVTGGTAQPKCAIIADAVGWSRANLHFCVETSQDNGSAYRASTSNSRMMIDGISGNVGIGTTTPGAFLDVNGTSNVNSYSSAVRNYFNSGGVNFSGTTGPWSGFSIRASNSIGTSGYFVSHSGTWQASDSRIKTNINDVTDASALEKLRFLEPKTYKYIDTNDQGDTTVYGFIAQEVSNVFPEAVKISENVIPNIYELSNVSDSNVITFTNFNTSDLLTSNVTSKIHVKTVYDKVERLTLDEVIDAKSIRVKEDLTNMIGSVDDTGNVVSGNQVFVMGQEVDNFNILKKEYIFTIATAALQEVDRQLQAEKTKVVTLETQVADLLARVTALENN